MGDVDSALANFTEAIGAAEAQYNLAYILYGQGDLVTSEEYLKKAIAMKPNLAQAQSLLISVRQQRSTDNKPLVARNRGLRGGTEAESQIQPASYSEVARPARSANNAQSHVIIE
jgi:tetratricopeptide (TPR) repeat protein